MRCKCDEDEEYWDEQACRHPGSQVRLKSVELYPAEDADLHLDING